MPAPGPGRRRGWPTGRGSPALLPGSAGPSGRAGRPPQVAAPGRRGSAGPARRRAVGLRRVRTLAARPRAPRRSDASSQGTNVAQDAAAGRRGRGGGVGPLMAPKPPLSPAGRQGGAVAYPGGSRAGGQPAALGRRGPGLPILGVALQPLRRRPSRAGQRQPRQVARARCRGGASSAAPAGAASTTTCARPWTRSSPAGSALGGSWLDMAESIQRVLKRRTLDGQHPRSPAEIGTWFQQAAQAWNRQPTPFLWNGKRRQRRRRQPGHGHAVGGSGAHTQQPLPPHRRHSHEWRSPRQMTH